MMKAIVLHSIVPVRNKPDEGAEQETQLMFAETVEILEKLPRWTRIRNDYDGQEGWVDFKMITPMTDDEAERYAKSDFTHLIKMPMAFAVSENNHQTIPLTAGTHLPNYNNGRFEILGVGFQIDPSMVTAPLTLTPDTFMEITRFFLNIPYLWGGKNALGMDCSGLSGVVLSLFGVKLPRNAREQINFGEDVCFLQEAKCGDLAFFDHATRSDKEGGASTNISHVGILLDSERIMHCSGRVKIERITPNGIINTETGTLSHDLRAIKRYV